MSGFEARRLNATYLHSSVVERKSHKLHADGSNPSVDIRKERFDSASREWKSEGLRLKVSI